MSNDQRVGQVLARLSFGARAEADFERVKGIGVKAYIEEQLNPDSIDDSALDKRLEKLPTLMLSTPTLAEQYNPPKPKPTLTPTPTPSPTVSPSPTPTEMNAAMPNADAMKPTSIDMPKPAVVETPKPAAKNPAPNPTPTAEKSADGHHRITAGETAPRRV